MPRYQFEPRQNHFLDFERAREAIAKHGGIRVKVSYPIMSTPRPGKPPKVWRGTNQPKTLSFTLFDDRDAIRVENEYGWDEAFVSRRERYD